MLYIRHPCPALQGQEKNLKLKKKKRRCPASAVCSALGTFILIVVVLLCLPLTIPRMFGYELYTVVTGSMEPVIPVGSLVYVKDVPPEDVETDDVIAFYGAEDSAAVITHRVVSNSVIMGEFITKGDANKTNDMNPVTYGQYIGKVQLTVPMAGTAAEILTGTQGKMLAACAIGAAVILQLAAHILKKSKCDIIDR